MEFIGCCGQSSTDATILFRMNPKKEIREFVIASLLFGDGASLADETSFLDSGIVDSTGMMEIIMFIEEHYRIKVQPEEMMPENLDSVNQIAAFILRKQSPAPLANS